jgi:thiosulfate/3-mercaptopyruvate sulfurtransferase
VSFTTLVSTAELAAHLAHANWVILDCQHDLMNPAFGRDAYAREHLPGARFISLDDDLAEHPPATGPKPRGRHPLPTPDALAQAFARLGIDASKQVVIYDSAGGSYSRNGKAKGVR